MTSRSFCQSPRAATKGCLVGIALLVSVPVLLDEAAASEVQFRTTPAGAAVFLDGKYVGVSPVTAHDVEPGKHLVRAVRRGYQPQVRAVLVDRESVSVELALTRPGRASLTVTSEPADAQVYLNGEYRGDTPLKLAELPPGRYHLRLEKINYTPVTEQVELEDGSEKTVERRLESRSVDFYLAQIQHDAAKVANYTELCHLYMLEHRFGDGYAILERGLLAANGPQADAEDVRRLYAEVEKIWEGQYEFATEAELAELRPRLKRLLEKVTLADPANPHNYQALAQIFQEEKDYAGALDLFQKAYVRVKEPIVKKQLEREISQLLIRQAKTYQKKKDYQAAIAQYRTILQRFPGSYNARTALAQIASLYTYRLRDLDKAAEVKREYIRLFPDSDQCPALLAEIAALHRRAKEYDKAITTYRQVIDDYPDYDGCPDAQWNIASLYALSLKDREQAVKEYRRFIELFPDDDRCANAYYQLASLYRRLNRPEDVDRALATLVARYPRSQYAYYQRRQQMDRDTRRQMSRTLSAATTLVRKKKYTEAAAAYRQIQKEYPDTYYALQAQQQLIRLYGRYLNDADKEREERRRFIQLFPDNDTCPSMQYQIAYSYYREKKYAEAIREYENFLKMYPKDDRCPRFLLTIGTIYRYYLKQPAQAVAAFQRLIRRYPTYDEIPSAYRYIGDCYVSLDRLKEAKEAYSRVVHDFPDSQAAYYAWRALRRLP